MNWKQVILWVLAAPLFVCCAREEPAAPQASQSIDTQDTFIPGEAVLLLTDEAADSFDLAARAGTLDALGISAWERVFPDAGEFEARHRAAGLHRWYRVRYDRSVARTKAGGELSALPGVVAVEFPRKKELRSFNDPYLARQWHYYNDGSLGNYFKKGIDINVVPVWEQYTGGSREVIVAVLDGGVDRTHEDLQGVVLSAEEGSRNFVEGYDPTDLRVDDHGTHVGGTIAAVNNNGIGVAGVAGGTDGTGGVRLMTCILAVGDDWTDDEAAAMVWAADHGAVISSNSWGYIYDSAEEAAAGAIRFDTMEINPIRDAIDYFIDNAGCDLDGNQRPDSPMKGGLVLFASGNDAYQHDVPSEYSRVVAVGAFGADGKMATYSTYGDWVDILAPGGTDTYNAKEWVLSSVPDNLYGYDLGTSMACPHAAGVAALLVSYFGGPGFTNDLLREALEKGATRDVLDLIGRPCGGGKLDALGSFEYLNASLDPDHPHIFFSTDYDGDWTFKSHETAELTVKVNGNDKARLPVVFETDCPGLTAKSSYRSVQLQLDALQAQPGDYSFSLRAGTAARTFPFTILPNHAPELVGTQDNVIVNAASAAAQTLDIAGLFEDPDGETLRYEVSTSGEDVVTVQVSGTRITLLPAGYGLTTMTIRALDARKASATCAFKILGRNAYQDLDIFPNPVRDYLHVRPATDRALSVELVNGAGASVYAAQTIAGPFEPLDIDMRDMPGGVYTLFVGEKRYTISKQ